MFSVTRHLKPVNGNDTERVILDQNYVGKSPVTLEACELSIG